MAPLVFIHGWGLPAAALDPLREAMHCLRGSVAQNLPGYDGEGMIPEYDLSGVVANIMDTIEDPVTLIGWSLGGTIAMQAALDYPEWVHKLVLINATPSFIEREGWASGMRLGVFKQFVDGLEQDSQATLRRFASLQFPPGIDNRAGLREIQQIQDKTKPAQYDALYSGLGILYQTDLRSRLSGIKCPTLVVQGTGDRIVADATADHLHASIPNSALHRVEHGGHAPFITQPQKTAEIINDFLSR